MVPHPLGIRLGSNLDPQALPAANAGWPISTVSHPLSPLPEGEGQGEGEGTKLTTFHFRISSDTLALMNPSRHACSRHLEQATNKRGTLEDITRAIVNSKEFVMRH
jgi:hypothetical protein